MLERAAGSVAKGEGGIKSNPCSSCNAAERGGNDVPASGDGKHLSPAASK